MAVTSDPVEGDTYFRGEVIELTLTFNRALVVDTAGGTPSIELDIGGARRRARYVRGSDTTQLVFAYAVESGDLDEDGLRICGLDQLPGCTGVISLGGGTIESREGRAPMLRHPRHEDQGHHRVEGARAGLSGGNLQPHQGGAR